MAAGDMVNLKKYNTDLADMFALAAGATIYLVTKAGDVMAYTIAGGATSNIARISSGDVTALVNNATHIFAGFHNGELRRYTIADGTQSKLVKFDSAIVAMAINTLLYIALADGHLYSYALA